MARQWQILIAMCARCVHRTKKVATNGRKRTSIPRTIFNCFPFPVEPFGGCGKDSCLTVYARLWPRPDATNTPAVARSSIATTCAIGGCEGQRTRSRTQRKNLTPSSPATKKCPPLPIFRAAPVLLYTSSREDVARARRAVVAARMRARESCQKSCRADKHGENREPRKRARSERETRPHPRSPAALGKIPCLTFT